MSLDHELIEEAASVLARADRLTLACHVGPDGDALGSMLALAIAAANAGKEVSASFGSPFIVPSNLGFLPDHHLVQPSDVPDEPEVMVVLDVGSATRLGELASNASRAGTVIVIDHHVTNEGFGDVAVIDPAAAATGELVFAILKELEWEITPEIALCLHTALVTDTGRFQYSNTTPGTLRIAAELVEAGATPVLIGRHVYEEAPFGFLKAAAVALGRSELDTERRTVVSSITHVDLEDAGIDWGDIDNLIDWLRLAVESDTAVLAKVHADGRVKVSMRSRGDTDVGALAASMGGGGHRLAAGFTTEGSEVEDVLSSVVGAVGEYR